MKFGKFEGTPEEIRNLCDLSNIKLSDYISLPEEKFSRIWLLPPAFLLVISGLSQLLLTSLLKPFGSALFFLDFALALWLIISFHLSFNNKWATYIAIFGTLILILLAGDYVRPDQTLDVIQGTHKLQSE